jgi:hypothetical protein
MRSPSSLLCHLSAISIALVAFVGSAFAQKVGDSVRQLPMKKYKDATGVLITSGTVVALDRPGLRLFMKCDKPFWGPLQTGSETVVLWPTVVQLAVWVKAAPMSIDEKKARFDDLAVGQRVRVQYIMQWVSYGWVDGLHCFARRVDIIGAPAKNKK